MKETSQGNLFSPILRLPPEVLEVIFIHGARDYYNEHAISSQVPSWVNVSYVCRLWRDIAINYSTLWTYHFLVSLRWTEEQLARSKRALLKVHIRFSPIVKSQHWWSSLTENLLNNVERIQELYLYVPDELFPEILSLRAPHLQRLEIVGEGHFRSIEVLDGHVPPLRTLRLIDCTLRDWSLTNLRGITMLSLSRISNSISLDIKEFLTILSGMNDLTVLSVKKFLAFFPGYHSSEVLDTLPKINLHHLVRLAVTAPHSALFTFLSCVNIPLQTKVRLEFESDTRFIDDFRPIYSFLTQRFNISELSSPTIRSLTIYIRIWDLSVTFGSSECARDPRDLLTHEKWGANVPLNIIIQTEQELWNSVYWIISNMCFCMPSANIHSLYVVRPLSSLRLWKNVLGHLFGLRYIKLSCGEMPDLASLLSPFDDKPLENQSEQTCERGSTSDQMLVPALEELELFSIEFTSARSAAGHVIDSRKLLDDALASRKARRPRLTVTDCSVCP